MPKMTRTRTLFYCTECGNESSRWEGQCPACRGWNTLVEEPAARKRSPSATQPKERRAVEVLRLADVGGVDLQRWSSGIEELDFVLGGGVVPASVILIGGEPGIGKSTLLLQAAAGLSAPPAGRGVLYATGEESAAQVRLRAARLGLLNGPAGERIRVVAEAEIGRIAEIARQERPAVTIVDSIQTATVAELDGPAGSVGQVRESALRLMEVAKGEGIAVILVGHVTKDGTLAGPKTLEHLVDAVLTLEGERFAALRLIRASKNRFGSTEEVGVFEMGEHGLAEVADPARAFLADHDRPAPGSVVAPTLEGSRPILVEVQALVAPAGAGSPRRTASGVDPNRVALLIAVLGRRAGIGLASHDVYINLAGGLAVGEPGLDLPISLALASSLRDRPIRDRTVAIGEVGLLGELRAVNGMERRLREAARLGFGRAIVPLGPRGTAAPSVAGIDVVPVATLREAVDESLADAVGRVASASARC